MRRAGSQQGPDFVTILNRGVPPQA